MSICQHDLYAGKIGVMSGKKELKGFEAYWRDQG
jgi:hypothetical protein